jgi:hypothetical protein
VLLSLKTEAELASKTCASLKSLLMDKSQKEDCVKLA